MAIVDPLFISMRNSLVAELDKHKPLEADGSEFYADDSKKGAKRFFDHFLSENRPLVIRGYAKKWRATEKWADKEYLAQGAGNQLVRLHAFTRHPWNDVKKSSATDSDSQKTEATEAEAEDKGKPIFSSKFTMGSDYVKEFSQHSMKETSSLQPVDKALERIAANHSDEEGNDRISFLDF